MFLWSLKSVKRKMDNSYPYTTPPDSLNTNYTYYESTAKRVILLHSLLEDSPDNVFQAEVKEHIELFDKNY